MYRISHFTISNCSHIWLQVHLEIDQTIRSDKREVFVLEIEITGYKLLPHGLYITQPLGHNEHYCFVVRNKYKSHNTSIHVT